MPHSRTTASSAGVSMPSMVAAEAMRLTAQDLLKLNVIDQIIPEPRGGAQRDRAAAIAAVGKALEKVLSGFDGRSPAELIAARRRKFLDMGRKGLAA